MPHAIPFRNRAHEVSRIEAFSDIIFGFAISLLVVSLEAPKTYAQMMEMLRGFLPFAILFYVYPLKFMFTLFTQNILGQKIDLPAAGVPFLYTIYGIEVASVFWLL